MRRCCAQYQKGSGFYAGPLWQEGGAIRGFAGPEWQVGGGFNFGRFIWRHAKPLLGYLAKQTLKTGIEVGKDALAGENFKKAAITRLKERGRIVAGDAIEKAQAKLQGRGLRQVRKTINKRRVKKRRVIRPTDIFRHG